MHKGSPRRPGIRELGDALFAILGKHRHKNILSVVAMTVGDDVTPLGRNMIRMILIASCLLCGAWLDPFHDQVSKGNEQFHEKKYSIARVYYDRAAEYAPGEEHKKKLSFNKGDSDYMLENFDGALARFEESLKSEDKDVQKKAFFNIGNAYVKQGKYKEAVQSYINALKIDPGYVNAKKNLEYLLMNRQDEKQKEQQGGKEGEGQQGKDGKDKDKNKDKNKDKSKDKDKNNQNKQDQKQGSGLSKAQVKNLLDSMKQNPVRRFKGGSNGDRYLEKPW